MKKIIFLLALICSVFIAEAQNKTVTIGKDLTYIDVPVLASDSIVTSQTYWILINNLQDYPSMQDVYVNLTAVSGSPSVAISLEGRKFTGDGWTEIISAQTWTSTKVNLTTATASRYRQYKLKFIASGATQKTLLESVELKTWFTGGNLSVTSLTDGTATFTDGAVTGVTTIAASGRITGTGGATITGAATNINASSNFATNIGTGSTNAAVSIGGGSNTVAVNSSDWDITTTGIVTGLGDVTSDGKILTTDTIQTAVLTTTGQVDGFDLQLGIACKKTTATAAADTTSAGAQLSAITQFVTVTSGNAAYKLMLPPTSAATIGMVIRGYVAANGFELRVAAADANTVEINDVTTLVEAAIPAETFFTVQCISATKWILTATDEVGAVITAIVPDSI